MLLGELKGQMRELIHNMNNMSAKIDGLGERVIGAAGIPAKVKELEDRVAVLEADKNKRDGASGIINALMKSPALGWLVGAATTAWAVITGRLHL